MRVEDEGRHRYLFNGRAITDISQRLKVSHCPRYSVDSEEEAVAFALTSWKHTLISNVMSFTSVIVAGASSNMRTRRLASSHPGELFRLLASGCGQEGLETLEVTMSEETLHLDKNRERLS